MSAPVSLVTYAASPDSLREAITLCDGFSSLKPGDRVVLKPNIVAWDDEFPIAPYGVYTTSRLIEDLVILLKEHGCSDITVGEGSVEMKKGVGTMAAYEGLGYRRLEKRYGIKLVDFNASAPVPFAFHDDLKLHIAREAVECDFFINVPVLKTHGQTRVSLGLKNLKGCLKTASKKLCHHAELDLEYCFSFIADFVKPALTVVDGIYALEKGALHYGNAYRKNVLIASTDPLGADLVAAKSIGFDPADIRHFGVYASRHGKSTQLADYRVTGEKLEEKITPLKWDWAWTPDNTGPGAFQKLGISGIALPKYDDSLCSGCSPLANMTNILVMSAFKGKPLPSIEVLNGKKMQARPGYEKTIMLGNCIGKANKENPNVRERVDVKGCPPSYEDVVKALKDAGLEIQEAVYHKYLRDQSTKYAGKERFDSAFFTA